MNAAPYIVLVLWLAGVGAEGEGWPMFRGGPALLGVAPGSLPAKLKVLWSFKTSGPIKSSAAIDNDRVFIGSNDGEVYALNLAAGKKLWSVKTGGPVESSPLVLGDKVFVGSSDAFLYALDAATGKLVWKYETGDKILGAPNWVKSGEATRVLVGSYDFKLHCVEVGSGHAAWIYRPEPTRGPFGTGIFRIFLRRR